MTEQRLIVCGECSVGGRPNSDEHTLHLSMYGPKRNVFRQFEDMRRALWGPVPVAFRDLVDIAIYVYCADQAISRGNDNADDLGDSWRRSLTFQIPVRDLDFWRQESINRKLTTALSFLSEDEYYFEFEPLRDEHPFPDYFDFGVDDDDAAIEEVVLFSGGLDSLAGAIQESVIDTRPARTKSFGRLGLASRLRRPIRNRIASWRCCPCLGFA